MLIVAEFVNEKNTKDGDCTSKSSQFHPSYFAIDKYIFVWNDTAGWSGSKINICTILSPLQAAKFVSEIESGYYGMAQL